MPDCIFCKIAKGEIPANKTYEDDTVVAFLDIEPKAPRHTLLIPKAHYRWFEELPDDIYNKLFLQAKKLAAELKKETGADYIRLSVVGTDVPHVHIHLIPRFIKDSPLGIETNA
jgi:histidine triad (HIT) family protein